MPLFDGRRNAGGQSHGFDLPNRLLVIFCAISLVLCFASLRDSGSGPVSMLRSGFSVIALPLRNLGAFVSAPFLGLSNAVGNLSADGETLSELRDENERLLARNAELEEAEQTALRLQALLDLQTTYDVQSIGARVISASTSSWTRTLEIDKGSSSGLAVGMPVLSGSGVIGQLIAVGPLSATVRLVTDENSGISAMVQSSRAQGMLQGSADGTLHLSMVRNDQAVTSGDVVITSGLGGAFPKGLPLGTVLSAEKSASQLYLDIVVQPIASVETNEEVLVVTAVKLEQQATQEDVAAADAQDATANATPSAVAAPAADPAAADAASDASATAETQVSDGSGE